MANHSASTVRWRTHHMGRTKTTRARVRTLPWTRDGSPMVVSHWQLEIAAGVAVGRPRVLGAVLGACKHVPGLTGCRSRQARPRRRTLRLVGMSLRSRLKLRGIDEVNLCASNLGTSNLSAPNLARAQFPQKSRPPSGPARARSNPGRPRARAGRPPASPNPTCSLSDFRITTWALSNFVASAAARRPRCPDS